MVPIFLLGLSNRQVGSHMMNDHSSRSHSMLTVYIDTESVRTILGGKRCNDSCLATGDGTTEKISEFHVRT